MPQVFKALATITVWILWISALVMGFGAFIMGLINGAIFNPGQDTPVSYAAHFAVAGVYVALALFAMKIRKGME